MTKITELPRRVIRLTELPHFHRIKREMPKNTRIIVFFTGMPLKIIIFTEMSRVLLILIISQNILDEIKAFFY